MTLSERILKVFRHNVPIPISQVQAFFPGDEKKVADLVYRMTRNGYLANAGGEKADKRDCYYEITERGLKFLEGKC